MNGTRASRLAAAAVASVLIAPIGLSAVGCTAPGELRTGAFGMTTQVGCDNVPIPETISTMRSAELTGEGALRLTTIHEAQLTLVQTRQEGVSLVGRWVGPASETLLTMVEFEPDGTLTATTGCGEMQGTWALAPAEQTEYRDPASDLAYIPGPGVLRIGPPTEHVPICTDAQVPPMLENDTEYSLSFGDAGSLVLQPLPIDFTEPDFGHLPLRRLADASEPVR